MTLQEIDSIKWLIDALDHLQQYQAYSKAMSKNGNGFSPASPFSPDYLNAAIKTALQNTIVNTVTLTPREKNILGL